MLSPVLLSILVLCSSIAVPFYPERVKIVDQRGSNYLLRGNMPITSDKFLMKDLKAQIEKVTGIPKAKQELIVYSLINHYTDSESKSALIEQEYFNSHPKEGKLFFYPILGFFFSPGALPEFMMRLVASYYDSISYDKLDSFLEMLNNELRVGKHKIIYFHCTHGLDRTGLVSAAYKMKFKNETYHHVMKENRELANRDLKWTVINGINWFCQQMRLGKPDVECTIPVETMPPEAPLKYEL